MKRKGFNIDLLVASHTKTKKTWGRSPLDNRSLLFKLSAATPTNKVRPGTAKTPDGIETKTVDFFYPEGMCRHWAAKNGPTPKSNTFPKDSKAATSGP